MGKKQLSAIQYQQQTDYSHELYCSLQFLRGTIDKDAHRSI